MSNSVKHIESAAAGRHEQGRITVVCSQVIAVVTVSARSPTLAAFSPPALHLREGWFAMCFSFSHIKMQCGGYDAVLSPAFDDHTTTIAAAVIA